MLWEKISNTYAKSSRWVWIILFIVLFLATRLPRLHNDVINPDGVNWHYRSEQFINGLKYFQFEKTYQHYHPGVTLMWVTAIPVEITKIITGNEVYNQYNFSVFHLVAKSSLVLAQLFLSLLVIFVFSKIVDIKKSVLIVMLFSLEPFFVGNSRLYHMDVLLSLFIFISLIFSYLYLTKSKQSFGILSGLFLALSFLTKSIGIGALVYVLGYLVLYFVLQKKFEVKKLVTILLSFILFTFLCFPAMWKFPVLYLTKIFTEGERVGIRDGHNQIIFGKSTENAGIFFYPLVILMKVSPFLLIGYLFNVWGLKKKLKNIKKSLLSFDWFMGIFYLGYFLIMFIPSKKIDRYMLVIYPILAYYAFLGIEAFVKKLKIKGLLFSTLLFLIFVIYPLFKFFPYYFTYYSPVFVSAENAHSIIAQKPFGMGMFDLKDHIIDTYGEVKMGFIDTKPMREIYAASKVFDIRINGTNDYDILILGPNEEMPSEVLQANITFVMDSSIYINGLEYWRIYVKEAK